MRRGQFEIMGLAVLIVIIMLGALFFMTRERPDRADPSVAYEYRLLAQSTVDTFLRTDVGGCPGVTVNDLVRDALVVNRDPCTVDGVTSSVEILDATAREAIEAVSGSLYDFSVRMEGEEPVIDIRQCPRGKGASLEAIGESRTPLFPYAQTAVVTLQFCPGAALR